MLIDPYSHDFEESLRQQYEALSFAQNLLLLIDGAFVPGLFREIRTRQPVLLFASFPGFSEKAKDVSPFLVRYEPGDESLTRLLKRCDGWPMVSAIATDETVEKLAERLAAWCIVEADGQRLNFRFPDTRRLPAIFEILTDKQRAEMIGSAVSWRYVGRDGAWHDLKVKPNSHPVNFTANAQLDEAQFRRLLSDSEPDELWVRLEFGGESSQLLPSQRYFILSTALKLGARLDDIAKLRWCSFCMRVAEAQTGVSSDMFDRWAENNVRKNSAILQRIA